MLHPGLAEVYQRKVEKLTQALNKEELRSEAAEMLRSMIQAIRLVPESGSWRSSSSASWPGYWRSPTKKAPGLLGRGLDK